MAIKCDICGSYLDKDSEECAISGIFYHCDKCHLSSVTPLSSNGTVSTWSKQVIIGPIKTGEFSTRDAINKTSGTWFVDSAIKLTPQELQKQLESGTINYPDADKIYYMPPITEEGIKHDQQKIPVELLPTQALEEIAKVLDFGQRKYERFNWAKGFKWTRLVGAAMRHLFAWQRGEDKDFDPNCEGCKNNNCGTHSGLNHLAHLGCCVLFLLQHQISNLGEDDRYKEFIKK